MLFAGAGTSIELGVPGMMGLGEEFQSHARQWEIEPDLVTQLMKSTQDVENLIEALDRICSARLSLETLGQSNLSLERVDKIRAEVEWFVQHAAERVAAKDAHLMWGPVLRTISADRLTLVTTNYDRAIELAANVEGVNIDDGFEHFGYGEAARWVGFSGGSKGSLLVKLHGSTDWYAEADSGVPIKLRHPMPLFGRSALQLAEGKVLGSALVLPSREKLLTHNPYPRLSQTFLNAADDCDVAVFVGSSLRDPHIRDAAETTARRVPVFLVNPSGQNYGLRGVEVIKQCASSFLISSLPNSMMEPDLVAALSLHAKREGTGLGVLAMVKMALESAGNVETRCRDLEKLDELGLTLDPSLLRLLLEDPDPRVARYSLGLISLSRSRTTLLEVASKSSHTSEPAFLEDLRLVQMLA